MFCFVLLLICRRWRSFAEATLEKLLENEKQQDIFVHAAWKFKVVLFFNVWNSEIQENYLISSFFFLPFSSPQDPGYSENVLVFSKRRNLLANPSRYLVNTQDYIYSLLPNVTTLFQLQQALTEDTKVEKKLILCRIEEFYDSNFWFCVLSCMFSSPWRLFSSYKRAQFYCMHSFCLSLALSLRRWWRLAQARFKSFKPCCRCCRLRTLSTPTIWREPVAIWTTVREAEKKDKRGKQIFDWFRFGALRSLKGNSYKSMSDFVSYFHSFSIFPSKHTLLFRLIFVLFILPLIFFPFSWFPFLRRHRADWLRCVPQCAHKLHQHRRGNLYR